MAKEVCKMLAHVDRMAILRLILGNKNSFFGSKFKNHLPPISKGAIYSHLRVLVDNGVLTVKRCVIDGRERVYSVNTREVAKALKEILKLVEGNTWHDKEK